MADVCFDLEITHKPQPEEEDFYLLGYNAT
jgi:hypothetical protein